MDRRGRAADPTFRFSRRAGVSGWRQIRRVCEQNWGRLGITSIRANDRTIGLVCVLLFVRAVSVGPSLRGLVALSSAWEPCTGHHFFALCAVTFAMRRNQQQPLIQIELAQYGMREEVSSQIGLSAGGKVSRLLAGRFEFLQ